MTEPVKTAPPSNEEKGPAPPNISLPKGGGAVRGIGEKFAANPVTGTGSFSVPVYASPGRAGFTPRLSLSYDSGSGNGPFGLGWTLSLPSITRKTDKGLPRYSDEEESDVFILAGSEDLVPVLVRSGAKWRRNPFTRTVAGTDYRVQSYRPRVEGLFARVERWTDIQTGDTHWRSISKENITSIFGKDESARIYDPAGTKPGRPARVFSWLLSESYDDKGNAIVYEYKPEDAGGVELSQANEKNRSNAVRSTNRYPKRIKYGNRVSRLIEPSLSQAQWMYELIFDYGEHDPDAPTPDDAGSWLCRHDPFSVYRAGFEVRTYRLCQRVLMFHHFPGEEGVGQDCLVRSTDFVYRSTRNNPDDLKRGHPIASFIGSIMQCGYSRRPGGYLKRSMPSLEFEYSHPVIQEDIRELDGESLENLPFGLDGSLYQWVDLDGEGVSGILTRQAGGWFYKRNLSPISIRRDEGKDTTVACFAPSELIATQPSQAAQGGGRWQLLDLAGDGQLDLVQFDRPLPGFYERTQDCDWTQFTPFRSIPEISWDDPNVRFVDLTGDGHADVIVGEDGPCVWYQSLAEEGFGPAERAHQSPDEEKGPRLVFADGTQSLYFADMSGDGLSDLVRVSNSEVCYWPNLGYGQFGAKVTMDDPPLLDRPELFDQRRVRLADVDGSGVTDLIYLGSDGVHIFFNQSGNGWDEGRRLGPFPQTDDLASVTVADLLGNGTACLIWSSPLPGVARSPVRYIDLMGGQKPHLLIGVRNGMGAETNLRYAPSTRFYLEDKMAGRPWVTRLPFPVQVIERVETLDRVSRNRFVSRYAYHHGYFDGVEREFRGFGMVEQWDTEEIGSAPDDASSAATNLDAASFVPPVHTKTWFHTGAYLGRERLSNYFAGLKGAQGAGEYYREPGWGDVEAKRFLLDDTALPDGLTAAEEREACRALKGTMLRSEVYGLDGTDRAQHPYTVIEQNFTVERLQPQSANRHAVFFTHPREALSYHYERNPLDPRVSHAITLEVDAYGNVLKSVAIGYGRKQTPLALQPDRDSQTRTLITYTENEVTFAVDDAARPDDYRAPLSGEVSTFELSGYAPPGGAPRFRISDFVTPDATDPEGRRQINVFDSEIEYEEQATTGRQRRLIERVRAVYRRDDLSGVLPLGQLEPLALPGQIYKLAFTPGLLAQVYQRKLDGAPDESLLPAPSQVLGGKGGDRGGYVELDADGRWWIPSARVFYAPTADAADPAATATSELTEARLHFFSPRKFVGQFDAQSTVDYDAHDLLVVKTEDAAQNAMTALYDYRILQPVRVTDPNGNRSEVRFDALGMVVGTALMGKATGPAQGDSFDSFAADLTPEQITDYFDAADPRPLAVAHLGTATTRIIYDLDRVPACSATVSRVTHGSDLPQGGQTEVQLSFVYSDGFGREAQTRVQAEPGPFDASDPASPVLDPRWIGTGTKVYNNKGKPVRQYEPFFSPTHIFGIEQHGVSRTLFYDAAERVVATLHPNHTWEKVVFDPWQQTTYDVNDTVQNADGSTDPKSDEAVKGFFSRLPDEDYLPTWYEQRMTLAANDQERVAAEKAAVHRQTPTVAHLDTLGRAFLTIAHNRFERGGNIFEEEYPTRVLLDIEGNQREVRDAVVQDGDASGRVVMRYDYDMLGNRIHQTGMEAGGRWTLNDVTGKLIRAWDSRGFARRIIYDELRRATGLFVTENGVERLAERTVYGESQGAAGNHRTRVFQVFDGAGVVTSEVYDFKGNLLQSRRDLLPDYKGEVDWQQSLSPDDGTFNSSTTFDAINRPTAVIAPDGSVYRPTYNEANLLDKVELSLRGEQANGEPVWTPFVDDIDYDAKGQRTLVRYANGAETTYEYDPRTFRLVHLKSTRVPAQDGLASQIFVSAATVQDLHYAYDPVGNITRIEDAALLTVFHNGQQVEPVCEYTYDAVYRLTEARGREHIGQATFDFGPNGNGSFRDFPFAGSGANPNDLQALRNYVERYEYDAVGNFERLVHQSGPNGSWTRAYAYDEPSLVEPAKRSNRLSSTNVGQTVENYSHDAHGNVTAMPHLTFMQWGFKDMLRATSRQAVNVGTPETTFYVYDASGQRVRKVTERQNGSRKDERIYLGGFEVYRAYGADGSAVVLERETLHVMDDKRRIALIETKTVDNGNPVAEPVPTQRCQLDNHLGSASLELDADGGLISYEEYHPYGTTAYQATGAAEVSLKRYRYTGKERDEETGFSYHGARYYAPWLGRWTAADPGSLVDGVNVYSYVLNNPVKGSDPSGTQTTNPSTPGEVEPGATDPLTAPLTESEWRGVGGWVARGWVSPDSITDDADRNAALIAGAIACDRAGFNNPELCLSDIAVSDPRLQKLREEVVARGPIKSYSTLAAEGVAEPEEARMVRVMGYLVERGYSINAAAGITGNLFAESSLLPSRIERSDKKTPLRAPNAKQVATDFSPEDLMLNSIPGGQPKETLPPTTGIGLAQWTLPSRRAGLFEHTFKGQQLGAMILFNTEAQVDYLVSELRTNAGFAPLNKSLTNKDITLNDASDKFLRQFENPADIAGQTPVRRNLGQRALNAFQADRIAKLTAFLKDPFPVIKNAFLKAFE
jgi:RHS repeat-associated protein